MSNEGEDRVVAEIELPQRLDTAAAQELKDRLLAARGSPLVLNARSVRNVGGLCLQVLLAARNSWDAQGLALDFTEMSDAFLSDLQTLGAEKQLLRNEELR